MLKGLQHNNVKEMSTNDRIGMIATRASMSYKQFLFFQFFEAV